MGLFDEITTLRPWDAHRKDWHRVQLTGIPKNDGYLPLDDRFSFDPTTVLKSADGSVLCQPISDLRLICHYMAFKTRIS
jgi:hypothetical protein